ncbi:MAG: hypothetical protein IGS48_06705 [Oscillatoriales cyanobacterium C42_A2020_001]|nr:hypothetical protein [Leptolyngbyaceae cyanobacterium C42_A2020_001]
MDADEALRFIEDLIRTQRGKSLNDLQRTIFRGAWLGKNYKEIQRDCNQAGLDHIMRNVGPRLWRLLSDLVSELLDEATEVRKDSLRGPIERLRDRLLPQTEPHDTPTLFAWSDSEFDSVDDPWSSESLNCYQDWGTAPDVTLFQGRVQELTDLYQWIEDEGCRLVALVGRAGIGKTEMSVKLAERLRDRFEVVIWRSLDPALTGQSPPPPPELLSDLLHGIPEPPPRHDLAGCIDYWRKHRCLIVLDGFEAVLQSKVLSGEFQPGYEGYGDLLRRLCDIHHQSCVLITSREKPREIEAREGEKAPVRSQTMPGLCLEDVQNLFFARGAFLASEQDWRSLIHQYEGNPRFLQQVATTIANAFGRDISRFLHYQQDKAVFVGDIRRALEQQISRLTYPEVNVIRELARHREPATLEDIQQFVKTSISPPHLLEVLLSLVRRSLLKSSSTSYSLPPLLIEYVAEYL